MTGERRFYTNAEGALLEFIAEMDFGRLTTLTPSTSHWRDRTMSLCTFATNNRFHLDE